MLVSRVVVVRLVSHHALVKHAQRRHRGRHVVVRERRLENRVGRVGPPLCLAQHLDWSSLVSLVLLEASHVLEVCRDKALQLRILLLVHDDAGTRTGATPTGRVCTVRQSRLLLLDHVEALEIGLVRKVLLDGHGCRGCGRGGRHRRGQPVEHTRLHQLCI